MSAKITFSGGAGSVTGANFLLDTGEEKMLIDCGTEEQEYRCDSVNFQPFPYDTSSIKALLVTHAHQDHIGRIPRLVREGFRGAIYSTPATKDLAAVMLEDALSVMSAEAEEHGCEILFDHGDIERALSLWQTHEYHAPFELGSVRVEFLDAGHILGSALVRIVRLSAQAGGERTILFTGDLGNSPEPLLSETESAEGADYIVIESVYGDRVHEGREMRTQELSRVVHETMERKGTLLIPSFSLERTQILLYELHTLIERGDLPKLRVYLDSPLAERVTAIFRRYEMLFNDEAKSRFAKADPFYFDGVTVTHTADDSKAIHRDREPKVIIAGAGMSAGGRVRAHEKFYLGEKHCTVLFVGYQAPGTLGRRIQDGAKKVVIDGEYVRIHARVETLTGYSGHADCDQLLGFLESAGERLERAFVVLGEPKASIFLAQRAHDFLGIDAVVPESGQSFEIDL